MKKFEAQEARFFELTLAEKVGEARIAGELALIYNRVNL